MARITAYTVVLFCVAPGTTEGAVPWWITGWDRPDGPLGLLARQSGTSYDAYRTAVPGWWPRRTPYTG